MLLTFSTDELVQKILDGTKIHTIREDKNDRWKTGRKIDPWYKNPRNVKQNPMSLIQYACKHLINPIGECHFPKRCISTQDLEIRWSYETFTGRKAFVTIYIDGVSCYNGKWSVLDLAKNDGFDSLEDFFKWFDKPFKGKIIHWTDFRY